jgi:hypothetical protein
MHSSYCFEGCTQVCIFDRHEWVFSQTRVRVALSGTWSDFVFHKNYRLTPLQELENFIQQRGHLPGIPTAAEVKAEGMELADMNARLLQKIEELTLYILQQEKRIRALEVDRRKQ